jgi:hypothetical protein
VLLRQVFRFARHSPILGVLQAVSFGGRRVGLVMPHIARTIDSTVEAINAGLQSLKSDAGTLGKVAVIVDRDLAEAS